MNKHEAGASFVITAPTIVAVAATMSTCTVTYNSIPYTMVCTVSGQAITVSTGYTIATAKGVSIAIAVGPLTNPITNSPTTASFTLETLTGTYKIDTISTGLVPTFDCTHPCKTCNVGQMS